MTYNVSKFKKVVDEDRWFIMKFNIKLNEVLAMWPSEIDISDGKVVGKSGFYSNNLSTAWNYVESEVGNNDSWKDMLVWAIYSVLHKKARYSFLNGIHKIYPNSIQIDDFFNQFHTDLRESKGYEDVLIEFEKELEKMIKWS